ncbi:YHS domain protein [Caulifigura coniformis]|uniref:YHS domain protein n=1 Tax=Caulifigura coniformis TaxID=2527983 RepID=A0A517SFS0_9PLAN|nr:YHS domain-containing protein [Caulifigura coniformis]QDT54971.1 YHS domain protein [Caulifigura coniformis]
MNFALKPIRQIPGASLTALVLLMGLAMAEEKPPVDMADQQKAALAEFNSLIGKWRGVGQPRRGSTQGAWQEQAEWVWDFTNGTAIRVDISKGKLARTLRITFDPSTKEYVGALTTAEGESETYRGKFQNAGVLTLLKPAGSNDEVKQITVTRLNEKRTLVLFEKRTAAQASFSRIAEVGYTREGARLATSSSSGPECIVTGGEGTMEVKYKGETYYVCCSGCKQAFEDNPEKIIAEAAERRKREREKAK